MTAIDDPEPREGTDPRVERTRRASLAAGYALLIEEGPDAVTHQQVATRANVSRTTVYKHFPTRAELLRHTIEVMGKPVPTELTGDLHTDLRRMLDDLVTDLADDQRTRAIATMMERAQHDATVAKVRDDLVCEAQDQFRSIIENGVASGELRPDIDVDIALSGLVGTFFFKRFMVGDPVDADLAERAVTAFITNHAA